MSFQGACLRLTTTAPCSDAELRTAAADFVLRQWRTLLSDGWFARARTWVERGPDSLLVFGLPEEPASQGPASEICFLFNTGGEGPRALASHWLAVALDEPGGAFVRLLAEHGYALAEGTPLPAVSGRFIRAGERLGLVRPDGVQWEDGRPVFVPESALGQSEQLAAEWVRASDSCACPACACTERARSSSPAQSRTERVNASFLPSAGVDAWVRRALELREALRGSCDVVPAVSFSAQQPWPGAGPGGERSTGQAPGVEIVLVTEPGDAPALTSGEPVAQPRRPNAIRVRCPDAPSFEITWKAASGDQLVVSAVVGGEHPGAFLAILGRAFGANAYGSDPVATVEPLRAIEALALAAGAELSAVDHGMGSVGRIGALEAQLRGEVARLPSWDRIELSSVISRGLHGAWPDLARQARGLLDDPAGPARIRFRADLTPPLAQYCDALEASALPVSAFFAVAGEVDDGPTSRMGGRPSLPSDRPWPLGSDGAPMRFLLQLDLATAPPCPPLPRRGLLLVFVVDQRSIGPGLREQACRVLLTTDVPVRGVDPPPCKYPLVARPCRLAARNSVTAVEPAAPPDSAFFRHCKSVAGDPAAVSLLKEIYPLTGTKLGGHSFFTQEDPRASRPELSDHVQLLQIDETPEAGLRFGDGGIAHVFVPRSDLARLVFDRAWWHWDSL